MGRPTILYYMKPILNTKNALNIHATNLSQVDFEYEQTYNDNEIFQDVKHGIEGYLSIYSYKEAGLLVTRDGNLYPVTNTSKHPVSLFEIRDKEDLALLFELYSSNNLFAIAHNHPFGYAIPSSIDIDNHTLPISMIIYSNYFDYTAIYPASYLQAEKEHKITLLNDLKYIKEPDDKN